MTISNILRALLCVAALCVASLVVISNGSAFASSQDKDSKFSAAACPPNCPMD